MSPTDRMKIFISHSHRDAALAERFEGLLSEVTLRLVDIRRSSKNGSIEYGNSWIDWIHAQVSEAHTTFILLTPSSFAAKWVLWEAGAVAGVKRVSAAASGVAAGAAGNAGNAGNNVASDDERQVIPISFQLPANEDLGPFQHVQVANGLDRDNLYALFFEFLDRLSTRFVGADRKDIVKAIGDLRECCTEFVKDAQTIFRDLQIYQRQDLVLEWTARLDVNLARDNPAFVRSARRWINIAFLGPARADDTHTPIDFRLHARLAEGFRQLKDWERAKEQLLLARELSPRDMLVLRELGRAELESRPPNTREARRLLEEMKGFDPNILEADEEALMLQARLFVEANDWDSADRILSVATELARESTYVANMRAVVALRVEPARAIRYFKDLFDRERAGGRRDIWTLGNLVNAALALGETEAADQYLAELKGNDEAILKKDSIARYFDDVVRLTKSDYKWRNRWP